METVYGWYAGSSPRVRGKLYDEDAVLLGDRLIPACAGKTGASSPRARALPAHPRVCGENPFNVDVGSDESGSSPRVRGKLGTRCRPKRVARLIPACAGKT